jgi:hypothetical protein
MESDPTSEASTKPERHASRREALRARLRTAGIPVPPPMTPEQQAEWDERLRQAAVENEEFWAEHRRAS